MCENVYIKEPPTCNTPVESNFHTVHQNYLAIVSKGRLADIRRRLFRLPALLSGKEEFVVEVY
jgi:hypothetical protein